MRGRRQEGQQRDEQAQLAALEKARLEYAADRKAAEDRRRAAAAGSRDSGAVQRDPPAASPANAANAASARSSPPPEEYSTPPAQSAAARKEQALKAREAELAKARMDYHAERRAAEARKVPSSARSC